MNVQSIDFPPEQPSKPARKRTITITGRAPVTIVEDEWPVIAESGWGSSEHEQCPWGWSIKMKVRQHVDAQKRHWQTSTIIHAVYDTHDESHEDLDHNQTVRVGRLLTSNEAASDFWKHIQEVGEELRERILFDHLKKYVTLVVDGILAKLPAHGV
jgi:hypothetical protein